MSSQYSIIKALKLARYQYRNQNIKKIKIHVNQTQTIQTISHLWSSILI